jgi:membrane protease subunit HflC
MNSRVVGLLSGVVLLMGGSTFFTLDAREVAVVTEFGAPIRALTEPGFYVKAPWPVHQIVRFDSRSRLLQVGPTEMFTKDKKNLIVEPFVVWRVSEPERFLESVGSLEGVEVQLSDLVISRVAAGLAQRELRSLFSVEALGSALLPTNVLSDIGDVVSGRLGVDVLEVRLRHVGLPLQNEQSIYERMRAERLRIANQYRSEGEEKAAGIRARADRQAAEVLAAADREAANIVSRAEEVAAKRSAETYTLDPGFYRYLRDIEALDALLDESTTLVLESDSTLFDVLQGAR